MSSLLLGHQPIFTIAAELEAMVTLGRTPYGERRFVGITGGTVKGAKLNGRILPGGADWQIVRARHCGRHPSPLHHRSRRRRAHRGQ